MHDAVRLDTCIPVKPSSHRQGVHHPRGLLLPSYHCPAGSPGHLLSTTVGQFAFLDGSVESYGTSLLSAPVSPWSCPETLACCHCPSIHGGFHSSGYLDIPQRVDPLACGWGFGLFLAFCCREPSCASLRGDPCLPFSRVKPRLGWDGRGRLSF